MRRRADAVSRAEAGAPTMTDAGPAASRTLDAAQHEAERAIKRAESGSIAVVDIEGDAGFGKTTALRRVLPQLERFQIRRSFGEERADRGPFSLLDDLIGDLSGSDRRRPANTFHATRVLSESLDRMQIDGPVAFVIDDLQWIDAESVDTLSTLLLRSTGAKLLVVAAHRPLRTAHPLWRRLVRDLPARTASLHGLAVEEVHELIRAATAAPPEGLAEALRSHTGGNPLHIVALLHEHAPQELAVMAERGLLPAPAELAEHMGARIARLSSDAGELLRALAVLGDHWADVPTAAAVAGLPEPDQAIAVLRDERLIRMDSAGPIARLRIHHSVTRAAVYESIPVADRRRLHGAAAARHADPQRRLTHRAAAAAPGSDDSLAAELAEHASRLHAQHRFRQSARLLRSAANVARSTQERRRRLLEADVESLFGRDQETLSSDPSGTADDPRERLVAAMVAASEGEWHRGWEALRSLTDAQLADDPLLAFRVRTLRAWCGLYAGRPLDVVGHDAQLADAMAEHDPALGGQLWLALAHARLQTSDEDTAWSFTGLGVDRATLSERPDGIANLLWRGCALALFGAGEQAVADLSLAVELIGDGTLDFADVIYYGYLGLAEFQVGRWQRASIRFDIAGSSGLGSRVPSILAFAPLADVIRDDAVSASRNRDETRRSLIRHPYEIGTWAADIGDVFSLAFLGDDGERRSWSAKRAGDLGDPLSRNYPGSTYLWIVAHALSASWAEDERSVREWARILRGRSPVVTWYESGVALLDALAESAAGRDASTALAAVAERGFGDVPVLSAITFDEASRVARRHGRDRDAALWSSRTQQLVAGFGGAASAGRRPAPNDVAAGPPAADDPLALLSDREREVAYLVSEGLSYSQIAQELFVTRSTVGFHLTNSYAKTNTRSRHELARLVRDSMRPVA